MLIAEHPGHWLNFVNRADNRGLTTEQQRQKYLREQLLFENFMSFQIQQRLIQQNQSAGGTPDVPVVQSLPSNCIQFVVNTIEDTYFEVEITSTAAVNYTVDWGDGTVENDIIDTNLYVSHTYEEEFQDYTVRICFDDPSLITELNFPGFD